MLTTLRACARGRVTGRCHCHRRHRPQKNTRSWDLGTSVARKCNKSVEVGDKLASGCLKSSGTAYKLHK